MTRRRRRSLCIFLRYVFLSIVVTATVVSYLLQRRHNYNLLKDLSPNARKYVRYKTAAAGVTNNAEIKSSLKKYNLEQTILNIDKFGPIRNETAVIVILVHEYTESFKYVLASLCDVIGVQETLLIFSHLYYDVNINKLIQSIEFCSVLQIFYPYTLQVYRDEFSANSQNDCQPTMETKDAKFTNCIGAATTDIEASSRGPENKQFWWWTLNKVFGNVNALKGHTGMLIVLEDDFYFLKDFLYMLNYMRELAKSFPRCELMSIGANSAVISEDPHRVEISSWDPKYHSGVLVLDSVVWNVIAGQYDLFCSVDDNSWSRSLLHLSLNRRDKKRFKVLYTPTPRAMKISSSYSTFGMHSIFGNHVIENLIEALTAQRALHNTSFPPYLEVYTNIELDEDEDLLFDIAESEGGWSDPRVIALCYNITTDKVKKLLLDMKMQFQHN